MTTAIDQISTEIKQTSIEQTSIDQTWVTESEWVYNPLRDKESIAKLKRDAIRFSTTTDILRSISKYSSDYTNFSKDNIKGMCEEWEELLNSLRQIFNNLSDDDKKFVLEDKEFVDDLQYCLPYMDVRHEEDCFCEQCFVNMEILPLPEFLQKLYSDDDKQTYSYAEEFAKMIKIRDMATEFENLSSWLKNVDKNNDKKEIRDKSERWSTLIFCMKDMYFKLSVEDRKEVFDLISTLDENVCFGLYVEKGEYEPMCFCIDCFAECGLIEA